MTLSIPPPTMTATQATPGSVAPGVYHYAATFLTANGESVPSSPVAVTVDGSHSAVNLAAIPTGDASVFGRNIYRTTVNGPLTTLAFVGNLPDNTSTSMGDVHADTGLGAPPPSLNAYSQQTIGDINSGNYTTIDQYGRLKGLLSRFAGDKAYQLQYDATSSVFAQNLHGTPTDWSGYATPKSLVAGKPYIAVKFTTPAKLDPGFFGQPTGIVLALLSAAGDPASTPFLTPQICTYDPAHPDTPQSALLFGGNSAVGQSYGGATGLYYFPGIGGPDGLVANTTYWLKFHAQLFGSFDLKVPIDPAGAFETVTSANGSAWDAPIVGSPIFAIYATRNAAAELSSDTDLPMALTGTLKGALSAICQLGPAAQIVLGQSFTPNGQFPNNTDGLFLYSDLGIGLNAMSAADQPAVSGRALGTGPGGYFINTPGTAPALVADGNGDTDVAPLQIVPSGHAGIPTTGAHNAGELYVDSNGVLYLCKTSGTPGTWKTVTVS